MPDEKLDIEEMLMRGLLELRARERVLLGEDFLQQGRDEGMDNYTVLYRQEPADTLAEVYEIICLAILHPPSVEAIEEFLANVTYRGNPPTSYSWNKNGIIEDAKAQILSGTEDHAIEMLRTAQEKLQAEVAALRMIQERLQDDGAVRRAVNRVVLSDAAVRRAAEESLRADRAMRPAAIKATEERFRADRASQRTAEEGGRTDSAVRRAAEERLRASQWAAEERGHIDAAVRRAAEAAALTDGAVRREAAKSLRTDRAVRWKARLGGKALVELIKTNGERVGDLRRNSYSLREKLGIDRETYRHLIDGTLPMYLDAFLPDNTEARELLGDITYGEAIKYFLRLTDEQYTELKDAIRTSNVAIEEIHAAGQIPFVLSNPTAQQAICRKPEIRPSG